MKRLIIVFLTLMALSAPLMANTHITILGTSDLHGNIWGFSYEDSKETANNGMARVYTYVEEVRKENPNTILIDAGDDIQGTIMTDDIYNKIPDEEHPVITAMNYMGYDAMTLGNHEFNWGTGTAASILSQADFPVRVNIAVIGTITPDVPIWDGGKEGIDSLQFLPANVAVKEAIAEIGDKADVIVVSAHMGMYAEFDEDNGSDSAQKILDDNPEVDVLQAAHNHVVVCEKQGETVIGGCRNGGRDVARFDLYLDDENNIVDSTVEIIDMTGVEPSSEIRDIPLVKEAHEKTISYVTGGGGEDGEGGVALEIGLYPGKLRPFQKIADPAQGGHHGGGIDKIPVVVVQADAGVAVPLEVVGVQKLHDAVGGQGVFDEVPAFRVRRDRPEPGHDVGVRGDLQRHLVHVVDQIVELARRALGHRGKILPGAVL